MGDTIDQSIVHNRIAAMLGEAGMGEVYRATDSNLDRDCRARDSAAVFHLRR